jgi:hypothetical protein
VAERGGCCLRKDGSATLAHLRKVTVTMPSEENPVNLVLWSRRTEFKPDVALRTYGSVGEFILVISVQPHPLSRSLPDLSERSFDQGNGLGRVPFGPTNKPPELPTLPINQQRDRQTLRPDRAEHAAGGIDIKFEACDSDLTREPLRILPRTTNAASKADHEHLEILAPEPFL